MDPILKILSGPIPIGLAILVVVIVNYVRVGEVKERLKRLEDHFINHLKNHARGGGDN